MAQRFSLRKKMLLFLGVSKNMKQMRRFLASLCIYFFKQYIFDGTFIGQCTIYLTNVFFDAKIQLIITDKCTKTKKLQTEASRNKKPE